MSITELAKTYEPAAVEAEAYRVWLDENCFTADSSKPGDPYSIVIPPPNVTGALHLGHAINTTLQDILVRMHRMAGFNTAWIPGIDHAGIATQAVVEKQLKEKENKTRHDVGRENLVERIWAWKQQYGDRILMQLQRLGCSCDWTRTRFTLDEQCAKAVRETFFKLFKDGLIYRGKRLVNWDVHLQTSISDDEIYHETVKTSLWHIKYPIVDDTGVVSLADHAGPMYMTVATTRPETLLGDTAVAVHSQDPRWNSYIGKKVRLPLTDRLIPIIADDILVDPKFGSGVVKVTPAHDPNDYAVYQRHLGQADAIDIINILNPDGTINANGGKYAGMKRDAARKKMVADLEAQGLLAKEEAYETQVGHSDRSKTPVEPYLSDQWFVKMAPLAEPALEVVRNGTIQFFPERHAQQYLSWLGEKRDWPISRQLWWGHRIPVWSRTRPIDDHLKNGRDALIQLARKGRVVGFSSKGCNPPSNEIGYIAFMAARFDEATKLLTEFVCVRPGYSACEQELVRGGFVQDPDVLDTWFSSALWPHSTLGWPEQTADLKKWYPTSVLLTGRDIVTLWVARMVMMGMYNMGERSTLNVQLPTSNEEQREHSTPTPSSLNVERWKLNVERSPASRNVGKQLGIPFHHVAINPTILDGHGERMSKSKGNGVDPVDIIDGYGADALRFTLTTMATETQDARMPVKKDAQGRNTSDKFDLGRNFCNKLWNAARFALSNLENTSATQGPSDPRASREPGGSAAGCEPGCEQEPGGPAAEPLGSLLAREATFLSLPDRWIISRFNRAVREVDESLSVYRFDVYAKICYDFFWRDFCDWYVEAIKPAMKDPARSAQTAEVLAAILDGILRLMHPMIPFITERLWWQLNEVRPQRGLPGRIDCPASKRLILAAWPTAGELDESAEQLFPQVQETIVAIRNVRNQYKVDVKKPVTVSIAAPAESKRLIEDSREIIELLATCALTRVEPGLSPPANAARALAAGCEIFIEGIVDPQAEKQRLGRRRDELVKLISSMRGRLANEAYISKAPAHLVKQTRDQLVEAEAELRKLAR